MPKVSVIVPVYNVEKYVEKCLISLVNQTLQDIEIIIVNDGSTDNSKKIIENYVQQYPQKIIYLEKENGGLSDARNYGMKFAKGEYIAFLDSDDYVDTTIYEKMYEKAVIENYDLVECDFIWKYDDKEVNDYGNIYKDKYEMLEKARVIAWNKLIKKELIDKTKTQFPKGLRYEDIEFFYELIPYINKFGFVKQYLVYYVQRSNSIANTQNERTKEIFDVLKNVIEFYKEKGFYEQYKTQLEYTYSRILLCSSLMRIVKIKDKKIRREQLNMTIMYLNNNFPNWKKNKILNENKSLKNTYMKSVNKFSFRIYSSLFRFKKLKMI